MIDSSTSPLHVPDDLSAFVAEAWAELGAPGAAWTSDDRLALVAIARAARWDRPVPVLDLPGSAATAAAQIARRPASVTASTVEESISRFGVNGYVELVGVVTIAVGLDVLLRMCGTNDAASPVRQPGSAISVPEVPGLKKRSAWVPIAGPPLPRKALSAVPSVQASFVRAYDRLYMPVGVGRTATAVRGLRRDQFELVATAVSHGNECFY